jgi:hypothetical protein
MVRGYKDADRGLARILLDDLTQVGNAELALGIIEQRVGFMAARPVVTRSDIDTLSDELRRVSAGLRTIKKHERVLLRLADQGILESEMAALEREDG